VPGAAGRPDREFSLTQDLAISLAAPTPDLDPPASPAFDRAVDLATGVVTLTLLVTVSLGVTGLPRILLALAFATFAPGWAVLGQSALVHGTSRYAVAVALSLTICTAGALALAWLRTWDPVTLFDGLGGATLLAVSWRSARHHRGASVARPPVPVKPSVVAEPRAPVQSVTRTVNQMRSEMATENLQLTGVTVHAVFLPGTAFAPHDLTDFFAAIQQRHPFRSFQRDTDGGAVMETAGAQRLCITRESVDYCQPQPGDFAPARDNVVDLLGALQRRLGVLLLANPSCRLQFRVVARPDLPQPSRVCARALGLASQLEGLGGPNRVGVGLQLTGQSDPPRHLWAVALQPGSDGSLLVDVTTTFRLTTTDGAAIGDLLDECRQFLTDHVASFVDSLSHAATGD
jgi:hypothetical protein